ncbi:hypothetical protein CBR_g23831 [Chara braunii]|uniref:Uncharacterized protein n=1 Tax=Chara braunii TaxID=69332 RepID=A0A388JVS2_CHABU|nr:hypothetical protein CBR_g23831 [Chara braunii]|eukprot:GBG61880.1 hypothetical protein CBR_g23831 [Chara braunii]
MPKAVLWPGVPWKTVEFKSQLRSLPVWNVSGKPIPFVLFATEVLQGLTAGAIVATPDAAVLSVERIDPRDAATLPHLGVAQVNNEQMKQIEAGEGSGTNQTDAGAGGEAGRHVSMQGAGERTHGQAKKMTGHKRRLLQMPNNNFFASTALAAKDAYVVQVDPKTDVSRIIVVGVNSLVSDVAGNPASFQAGRVYYGKCLE